MSFLVFSFKYTSIWLLHQSTYAGEFDGQNVGAGAVLQIQKSGGSRLLKT